MLRYIENYKYYLISNVKQELGVRICYLSSQKRKINVMLIHRTISRYQVGPTLYSLTFYMLFVAVLDVWSAIAQAGFELIL